MRGLLSLQATVKIRCPGSAQSTQAGLSISAESLPSLSPYLSLGRAGVLASTAPLGTDGPMGLLPAGHRFFQFMLC